MDLDIVLNTRNGRQPSAAADPLWARIRDLPLGEPGAPDSFTDRLARDHLWTAGHAAEVVREYRRFLYLAATRPADCTPSEDVEAAWRLHFAHTRSYWDDLCGKVLRRPLHHLPTDDVDDDELVRAKYGRTLAAYREAFGAAPPPAIWPGVAERFSEEAGFRTVSMRDFQLVAWPLVNRSRFGAGAVALAIFALGTSLAILLSPGPYPNFFIFSLPVAGAYAAYLVAAPPDSACNVRRNDRRYCQPVARGGALTGEIS